MVALSAIAIVHDSKNTVLLAVLSLVLPVSLCAWAMQLNSLITRIVKVRVYLLCYVRKHEHTSQRHVSRLSYVYFYYARYRSYTLFESAS